MNEKERSIAIVGCGGMGSGHALAILYGTGTSIWFNSGVEGPESIERKIKIISESRLSPLTRPLNGKLKLKGVYDIREERRAWAASFGIYNYESYEAMLADPELDIVLIATPNHLHKDMAIRALGAGKHVLCEKPVMMTSADLEEVLAVAKETGKVFYPRQNRRWDYDFRMVKQVLEDGTLGRPFCIESRVLAANGVPGDWRNQKAAGGGMMYDWGVHLLDRLIVLIPEKITQVFCYLYHVSTKEVDDGLKMLLTFESGLTAIVEVGTVHYIKNPLWYVCGDKGTLLIKDWDMKGDIVCEAEALSRDAEPILAGEGLTKTMAPRCVASVKNVPFPEIDYDHNELYHNLVDTINGDADPIVTGEQALRVLRLMEAGFESAEKGEVVCFEKYELQRVRKEQAGRA